MILQKKLLSFAIIIISMYISWLPVYSNSGAWMTFDLIAHTDRAISTANELRSGQIFSFFDFSYPYYPGYSWNLFYPPLENFIYTGLYLFSNNINFSLKILTILITIIAFIHSFISFIYLNINKGKSLFLAILFSSSLYQIDNLFIRGAIPESLAVSFIPLFIASLINDTNNKSFLILTYAITGMLLSNIPLFLCCGLVGFVYLMLDFKKFNLLVKSFIFSIALSSFYFLPLLYSMHGQHFPIMDTNWFPIMSEKSITFYELISGEKIKSGKLSNMVLGIGWPLFILFLYSLTQKTNKNIIGTIAILTVLITCAADYSFLPEKLYFLNKIQYTWRLIPFLLFLLLVNISLFEKIKPTHLLISIFIISLMSSWMSVKTLNSYNITELNFRGSNNTVFTDYTLKNTKKLKEYDKELSCTSQKDLKNENIPYSSGRGKYGLPYFIFSTDKEMQCVIPVMAYNSLVIDGERESIDGYLAYKTSAGENIARIEYHKYFLYTVISGFVLSFIFTLYFVFLVFYKKR
ncbi:hypothetical protein [Kosakonia sp. MUSA4]|uniref:hypothetical protein n=1 Tax=Kosakonia sp. MUSA4 TaxID=2067958 RepID=UPI001ABFB3C4|nr:hypothetical protein [Kosakonia sp. MUSA4]